MALLALLLPLASKPASASPDEIQSGGIPKRPCEEPQHTIGNDVRQCRTCAKSVCMTCIVKASLPRFNENVFQTRRRLLCKPCWDEGKSQDEREVALYQRQVTSGQNGVDIPSSVRTLVSSGTHRDDVLQKSYLCQCKGYNGTLCLTCKKQQMLEAQLTEAHCTQPGCTVLLTVENYGGSRCRWCGLTCGPATRIERREIFRMRRKSTLEHTAAVAGVEGVTADSVARSKVDDVHRKEQRRPKQFWEQKFERLSHEEAVQRHFGDDNAGEERGKNQARWRPREEAVDSFWQHRQGSFTGIHPIDVKWLNHDKSIRKSKPLIGEGRIPKSLALFKPLDNGEPGLQAEGIERKISAIIENEEGEEDTLYDGNSDAGTLKNGKTGGKGKTVVEGSDEHDDDTKTINSMGSTLYEGVEASTGLAEQDAISSLPPQYSSVIPTEVDREWALFCAKGF